jgi:hypothetical protein
MPHSGELHARRARTRWVDLDQQHGGAAVTYRHTRNARDCSQLGSKVFLHTCAQRHRVDRTSYRISKERACLLAECRMHVRLYYWRGRASGHAVTQRGKALDQLQSREVHARATLELHRDERLA